MSTRQQQLARLTPSQLIELAYLCALLEQHPCGKSEPLSHKFKVIKSFLERVVHVVPLESVAFAVAYGSREIAVMCLQGFKQLCHQLDIPTSALFVQALGLAVKRFSTGVPGSVLREMSIRAYEQLSDPLPKIYHSECTLESPNMATLSLVACAPGGYSVPSSKHLSKVKMSLDDIEMKCKDLLSGDETDFIVRLWHKMSDEKDQSCLLGDLCPPICRLNIKKLYPINCDSQQQQEYPALNSPLDTLVHGRRKLGDLRMVTNKIILQASKQPSAVHRQKHNQLMLRSVNNIRMREVATCATLLGAFMEQEAIVIGLTNPNSVHLDLSASASVGVWALFSLDYSQVKSILAQYKGEQVLVKIGDYVKVVLGSDDIPDDSQYAAKLQFMAQGMIKTVTCNSQYVSYSLERQLTEMCKDYDIDATVSVEHLLTRWSSLFQGNVLSLVQQNYRPLIARWLKWALMIHELREELAKYTTIGVVGLVNSGKSKLVNTVVGIKVNR